MRAHTIVHIDAGSIAGTVLRCDQANHKVSFRVVDGDETQIWFTGTAGEFDQLAVSVMALAIRIRAGVE